MLAMAYDDGGMWIPSLAAMTFFAFRVQQPVDAWRRAERRHPSVQETDMQSFDDEGHAMLDESSCRVPPSSPGASHQRRCTGVSDRGARAFINRRPPKSAAKNLPPYPARATPVPLRKIAREAARSARAGPTIFACTLGGLYHEVSRCRGIICRRPQGR